MEFLLEEINYKSTSVKIKLGVIKRPCCVHNREAEEPERATLRVVSTIRSGRSLGRAILRVASTTGSLGQAILKVTYTMGGEEPRAGHT